MPGHRDDRNEIGTVLGWYEFHKSFESEVNSDIVVKDFFNYCKNIF